MTNNELADRLGAIYSCDLSGYDHAALQEAAERLRVCPACNGNDGEMPCSYPSEGMPGCLRDEKPDPSNGDRWTSGDTNAKIRANSTDIEWR